MNKSNKKTVIALCAVFAVITAVMLALLPYDMKRQKYEEFGKLAVLAETDSRAQYIIDNIELYPDKILQYYYSDSEDFDYVYGYPEHKDDYLTMSFTDEELEAEEIPALYMHDPRWAYVDDGVVKKCGCGAVCMTMANLYLHHDSAIEPVAVMRFAEANGYKSKILGGIESAHISDVLAGCGFEFTEHNFDLDEGGSGTLKEEQLKADLDKENTVIMAAMYGDTFGSHAIIIRGYDENGFYINDPEEEEKTAQVWDFSVFSKELMRYYELS